MVFNPRNPAFLSAATGGASSIAFNPDGSPIIADTDSRAGKAIYKFEQVGTGTFVPTETVTCEVLVAAGGAGGGLDGGNHGQGGGGAGGLSIISSMSVSAGSYDVVVGEGGLRGTSGQDNTAGNDSSFNSIVSDKGGLASNYGNVPDIYDKDGGSGGGCRYNTCVGGTATQGDTAGATGYGNDGGDGGGTGWAGTGGGGAGSVGGDSSSGNNYGATGGNGGNGYSSSITGTSIEYCHGGGGSGGRSGYTQAATTTKGSGGVGGHVYLDSTDGIDGTVIIVVTL